MIFSSLSGFLKVFVPDLNDFVRGGRFSPQTDFEFVFVSHFPSTFHFLFSRFLTLARKMSEQLTTCQLLFVQRCVCVFTNLDFPSQEQARVGTGQVYFNISDFPRSTFAILLGIIICSSVGRSCL